MTKSMTAFSREQQQTDAIALTWEIKAVNHRYLDLSFRLPDGFKAIETELRRVASEHLSRGKVECSLRCQLLGTDDQAVEVNHAVAQQFIDELSVLTVDKSLTKTLEMTHLLTLPGVLTRHVQDLTHFQPQVRALFTQALEAHVEMRQSEGTRLAQFIQQRIEQIADIVIALRSQVPMIRAALKAKVEAKLAEVVQEADADRLEQEIVYAAQKMDVDEELDRLESHIQEVKKLLNSKKPIGRRLDFLMQEFNREANTLASKSQVADTTNHAVDLKVLIEQMREQVQNIE